MLQHYGKENLFLQPKMNGKLLVIKLPDDAGLRLPVGGPAVVQECVATLAQPQSKRQSVMMILRKRD
ncbi:MAG: hypothetical protein HW412_1391 [Bacteroidetes bacterium]|nr:hypothetical protein [Bacteroidota bacterium]